MQALKILWNAAGTVFEFTSYIKILRLKILIKSSSIIALPCFYYPMK